MTIPDTIEGLINTASKYQMSGFEISIMLQQYAKNKGLAFNEGEKGCTISKRGVEVHFHGYGICERPQVLFLFKDRLYKFGFDYLFNLN